jgi:hypothetical protein
MAAGSTSKPLMAENKGRGLPGHPKEDKDSPVPFTVVRELTDFEAEESRQKLRDDATRQLEELQMKADVDRRVEQLRMEADIARRVAELRKQDG